MPELVETRWTRFGHDRVYFKTADGAAVGWVDLKTGHQMLEHPSWKSGFDAAVAAWARHHPALRPEDTSTAAAPVPDQREARPPQPAVAASGVVTTGSAAAWQDLAESRAGALARAKARELRDEAPVRTLVLRAIGAKTDERSWRIGADGERVVGKELDGLAQQGWKVIHSVAIGVHGTDIDHVVIGPGGVFTVNTKHHPDARIWVKGDAFKVNGYNQPYVHVSRHEAQRASALLSAASGSPVRVRALIVVVNAASFDVTREPVDVGVTTRKSVQTWLTNRPAVLGDRDVSGLFDIARRSTTWTSAGPAGA